MTLHLIKLSVGTDSIEDLAQWQAMRLAEVKAGRLGGDVSQGLAHRTWQWPKRGDEIAGTGSIYWVIKGLIQCRQKVTGFAEGTRKDGKACCLILLDPVLVPVRPTPRRPFQGWRYFDADDTPPDLGGKAGDAVGALTPKMRKELADLGLL
jgi:hypothetical protein